MHYEIMNNTREFEATPEIEDYITKKFRVLDRLLASFPQDEVMLRIIVDDEAEPGSFQAKLRLSLPSRLLTCEEAAPTFSVAFDQAIKELRRQLIDYKDKLRQHSGQS